MEDEGKDRQTIIIHTSLSHHESSNDDNNAGRAESADSSVFCSISEKEAFFAGQAESADSSVFCSISEKDAFYAGQAVVT